MSDSENSSEVSAGLLSNLAWDSTGRGPELAKAALPKADVSSDESSDDDPLARLLTPGALNLPARGSIGIVGNTVKESCVAAPSAEGIAAERQRLKDEIFAEEGVDVEMLFAAAEDKRWSTKVGTTTKSVPESAAKKQRLDDTVVEPHRTDELPSLPLRQDQTAAREVCAVAAQPTAPPPEKVVQAFATLDLPLTATAYEVQKRSRRLSFRHHPDKVNPNRRWQSAQTFRQIQDAKATVLGWLREGRVNAEDSDDSVACGYGSENEESSGMGDAGGNESGSLSDERQDELDACGIKRRSLSRSPSPLKSDESSDGGGDGAEVAIRSQFIHTGQDTLQQALSLKRQVGAIGENMCQECFVQKARKRDTICADCHKEIRKLEKHLNCGRSIMR